MGILRTNWTQEASKRKVEPIGDCMSKQVLENNNENREKLLKSWLGLLKTN